jgi:bifunctional UDP-N-acetylglucosamine pyrophosphorylase/glucosamine-1-phosphate N-acetyltransferase
MNDLVHVIVLAAGKGSRMCSETPKPLHCIGGRPMLLHVLEAAACVEPAQTLVVTAPGDDQTPALISPTETVIQPFQNGTGDAVRHAINGITSRSGIALVLFGDAPLIKGETLKNLLYIHRRDKNTITVLGFKTGSPGNYGRLVRDKAQGLSRIVEAKDASPEELKIELCNSGIMTIDLSRANQLLASIDNKNKAGEIYLTDLISAAVTQGWKCDSTIIDESETLGANDRVELARLENAFQTRMREHSMRTGVTLVDPSSVTFSWDTQIEADAVIEPNVVFGEGVHVKSGATIRSFSHIEGATIHNNATVGPFARLRPGARIGENARIGNFVEIKNSDVYNGAKISHLSYIGDAEVGQSANIGAGTITCNYDGHLKHKTRIGAGAFIGSNTALVAPIDIGTDSVIGAGSTITQNVPANALTLERGKETTKSEGAIAYRLRTKSAVTHLLTPSDLLRSHTP